MIKFLLGTFAITIVVFAWPIVAVGIGCYLLWKCRDAWA